MRRILVARPGRSAARRPRPRDAGADAASCRSSSCSCCRTRPPSRFATRRPTSSISIGRATSRGLVEPVRGVGPLPDRRAVGLAGAARTRRCSTADVTMVLTIPRRLRASLVRTGRGAGADRRQRREGLGRGHRAVVRGADSGRVLRRADAAASAVVRVRTVGVAAAGARSPRIDVSVAELVQPDAELPALHGARASSSRSSR